jgi:hypothetical protein
MLFKNAEKIDLADLAIQTAFEVGRVSGRA